MQRASPEPPGRLGTAIRLSLEFRAAGRTDIEAFLTEHAPLRDLIAPMIDRTRDPRDPGASITAPERFARGTEVGGYRIERTLGRGGMGTVFLARQVTLGRQVALKVLSTPLGLATERALWRFQREARLLAELDHPGIVKVFEAGVHEDVPWYAMELVVGASLSTVLAAVRRAGLVGANSDTVRAALFGALPEPSAKPAARTVPSSYVATVVEIGAQVAEALACAHAAGVIHRDVKPGNVLLRSDGRALLADFGVAHREGAAALTVTGDFAGTPTHMSPEQARGEPLDHRSDVFSLGVLLYEALTLRLPFEGDNPLMVLQRLQHDEPIDPARHNHAVPAELAAIVSKALSKPSPQRYQSAHEFAADLQAFLAGRAVSARRPSTWQRTRRWLRREPWQAAALGVTVAAALALLGTSLAFTQRLLSESERTATALAEVNRLAIGVRIERAERSASAFRVARAEAIPAMRQWLHDIGEPLANELPGLVDLLTSVRTRALPYGDAEAAADRATHPEAESLRLLDRELALMNEGLAASPPPTDVAAITQKRDSLQVAREPLQARVEGRRTWRFEPAETQFLHDQVEALVTRLRTFAESDRGQLARVRDQVNWAIESHRRCVEEAGPSWRAVADAVAADERFRGLRLRPQRDLLPLLRDPASGLWEFVHLRSGEHDKEAPARRPDGAVQPTDGMGIVFVLLPGGIFSMGAQADDPSAANFDPEARPYEGPVHGVELAPFFLSKYETTQAQWHRLTGGDAPSYYSQAVRPVRGASLTQHNPVESVSFRRALEVLMDHGLGLPTEAQWEYACRGGSAMPFHFVDRSEAPRYANFADTSVRDIGGQWEVEEDLTDGYVVHAPIGSFLPNGFGLFDMHGNVEELTCDLGLTYRRPTLPGDGLRERQYGDPPTIMQRGGGFSQRLKALRCSDRSLSESADYQAASLGVRAARAVEL